MREWIKQHLIRDWRFATRLWSMRLALFWAGVSGLFAVWPELGGAVPAPIFACCSVVMSIALMAARLTKQKGLGDE
jgi:uncharacterized membrane protein YhhN